MDGYILFSNIESVFEIIIPIFVDERFILMNISL